MNVPLQVAQDLFSYPIFANSVIDSIYDGGKGVCILSDIYNHHSFFIVIRFNDYYKSFHFQRLAPAYPQIIHPFPFTFAKWHV